MTIAQPTDPTRLRITGVALGLVPGLDPVTGRPWAGLSEVRRAPQLNGDVDTANAVTIADNLPPLPPAGAPFVDVRSSGFWYYSWRHKGPGYTPGNWSAWVGGSADVISPRLLATSITGGVGAGVFSIARGAEIRDKNAGNMGAVTTTIDWADQGGVTRRVRLTASGGTILFKNGRPGQKYHLIVQQDGTGSRTIATWDPAIAFTTAANPPSLTTTVDRADLLSFDCVTSGGAVRYIGQVDKANVIQNNVQVAIRDIQVLSSMVATTTIALTGLGFAPTLVLVIGSGRNDAVDAAGRANFHTNFGAATGAALRRSVTAYSTDAASTSASSRWAASDAIANEIDGTSRTGALDISSFDSDGVTFIVDDQYVTSRRYTVVCIGGETFKATIGDIATPLATGTQDITGIGWDPTGVIFFGAAASAIGSSLAHGILGLGFGVSSSARYALCDAIANAQTTQEPVSYGYTGECLADGTTGALPLMDASRLRADFVSFLSGGFRINWLETVQFVTEFYIAVAGCRCGVANLATQTDTTTDITVSGLTVLPKFGLLVSHNRATSTQNTNDNDAQVSIGVFGENPAGGVPIQRAVSNSEQYNASAAAVVAGAGAAYAAAYQNLAVASGAEEGKMQVTSITSGGFVARMSVADPVASRVGAFVIGA